MLIRARVYLFLLAWGPLVLASCGRSESESAALATTALATTESTTVASSSHDDTAAARTVGIRAERPPRGDDSGQTSATLADLADNQALQTLRSLRYDTSGKEWALAASDTEYLWNMEHHANVLVKFGFRAIADAMTQRDVAALAEILANSFDGDFLDHPEEVQIINDVLHAVRQQPSERPLAPLDREGLVSFLMLQRERFSGDPSIRFDVKRIVPSDRADLSRPWSAVCQTRVWGELADGGGPGEVTFLFRCTFERPTKERMRQPGWLLHCSIDQLTSVKAERFLFREVASEYQIDGRWFYNNWKESKKLQNSGNVVARDFNRDGCVDLFVMDSFGPANQLCMGLPDGGFKDVTRELGLIPLRRIDVQDAAFIDIDQDGWDDLVLSNGQTWRNLEGRRFEDYTSRSNLAQVVRGNPQSVTLTVVDYDRDGHLDLYRAFGGSQPTSWLEDAAGTDDQFNQLLRNLGDWQFADVTEETNANGGARSCFTAAWLDANNDLWPDVYVINEFGDGALLVNQQGASFREMDIDADTDDFGSMGLTTGDIDNDGNIDLYLASMYSKAGSRVIGNLPEHVYPDYIHDRLQRLISGSEFYQNNGDLNFMATGQDYQIHDVGWAWGPTLADFDNDGLLDIYAPAGYMSRDRAKPDG